MLAYEAHSAHGPVSTASPELLLAVFALLDDQPARAGERDLLEALSLPLVDPLDESPSADPRSAAGRYSPAPPARAAS